jgi:5'-nucleotidase
MDLARALPAGAVDLIVGGHTHRGMAHVVNRVPVIQSFANGVALGRADITVDLSTRRVQGVRVLAPRSLCAGQRGEPDASRCAPAPYEGATVTPDESVARAIAPAVARAEGIRARELGVTLPGGLDTRYDRESPLPNLLALAMRTAAHADVGLQNHGGVRVDLPAGPLRYGSLYNTLPFDNRLVTIRLRGRALAEVIARNAGSDSGALAVSGVRAVVRCEGDRRVATLTRDDGRPVGDDEVLTVATNDYLASGSLRERAESPLSDDETLRAPTLRDAVIDVLRALGPTLSGEDPRWFEPARLRITLPGPRPVRCGG